MPQFALIKSCLDPKLAIAYTDTQMEAEEVRPLPQTPRPGRMKRAQSAFKVKLRRGDSQQATPQVPQVKPSTLARRGWRGVYLRKPRKKRTAAENLRDVERSRLLFNEMFTATPMVVALASSVLVDKSGDKRVPVLLNQLSVHVEPFPNEKKMLFKISLEYGSGMAMLKWSLIRSYRDFMFFHGHLFTNIVWHRRRGAPKPPHLPRPKEYGGGMDLGEFEDEDEFDGASSIDSTGTTSATLEEALKHYLERVFQIYSFHGDSNRVLHFIELSRLGLTLAAETAFHGKEGPVFVRGSASNQGWRVRHWQPHDISNMVQRHTQKWLLVRESYFIITENINSTKILDVFLVDPVFTVKSGEEVDLEDPAQAKGLFLTMHNASRALRVATRGELDLGSWLASIKRMQDNTIWSKPHRFDSFAPVRKNVSCEWFVDGRDYMWVLSEALENSRDTIFIHDWWLSPELYLRRPPEGNQRWRLDRTLQRAAMRGVKIYVIVYRNIDLAIPIDSMWTKYSLFDLHKNIHVLRSPNQPKQKAAMFWAHHEKICIIDSTIAFAGGIDLCYGRWDTPQHTIIDDARKPFFEDNGPLNKPYNQQPRTQTWPGKDYSNPRVKDFFELDKPWDDMYDRQVTPRMPWHDIHQSVLGQPARDLARHFVQRWNYVIRQKLPSRETPLLLPPPDFTDEELERFKLTGTCEYQVLRSSCNWSLGLKKHEQSIQNAYLSLIGSSEHFVYIENQFFITATEVDGVKIENEIGNALVQRIIQAHERREKWRAIIVIPLMPGFEAPVDSSEASSVRVICQCQFNSISRGKNSIFYKLESAGIIPDQYISFFSLRKWGKIGPESRITTEQLYIHAKMLIADDRAAIIGSANINERSMRGVRDSEVAVCVRDTAVMESRMAGKPYQVGKFAYTLRLRLMREHLGIDNDKVDCIEQLTDWLAANRDEGGVGTPSGAMSPGVQSPSATPARTPAGTAFTTPLTTPRGSPPGSPLGYFDRANGNASGSSAGLTVPNGTTINGNGPGVSASRDPRDLGRFDPRRDSTILTDSRRESAAESRFDYSRRESVAPGVTVAAADQQFVENVHSFNWHGGTEINPGYRDRKKISTDRRIMGCEAHKRDVEGGGLDQAEMREAKREQLESAVNPAIDAKQRDKAVEIMLHLLETAEFSTILEFKRLFYYTWCKQPHDELTGSLPRPMVDEDGDVSFNECFRFDPWALDDPVSDEFYLDKWLAAAERNTDIYRQVFRCQPDNEVTTWGEYKKSQAHESAFYEKQATEGGPEADHEAPKAPERVNIHVHGSGIPDASYERTHRPSGSVDAQKHQPHLGQAVPGVTVTRPDELPQSSGPRAQSGGTPNGAKSKTNEESSLAEEGAPLEIMTSASSSSSANSSSTEGRHRYEGHPGSSTTAGVPGIPGLAAIFGTQEPFDPKKSEFPQHRPDLNGSPRDNDNAHASHRRKYVDAAENFDDAASAEKLKTDTVTGGTGGSGSAGTANGREASTPSENGTTLGDTVTFPDIERTKTETLQSKRSQDHTSRRFTSASRRWKHYDQVLSAQSAEEVLSAVTGHLVLFPTEWLRKEIESENWNFHMDRMTPLEIYD